MSFQNVDVWIRSRIRGRIALLDTEAELLFEMCRLPGDHLDIGTLWGGSAILAALAKPLEARVVTLDAMNVHAWGPEGDPMAKNQRATPGSVLQNFADCGVADRISMVLANSWPWPVNVGHRFSTAFLDGDHEYPSVEHDWESAVRAGCTRIGIHDCGPYGEPPRPGPLEFINDQVIPNKEWKATGKAGGLMVFER